MFLIIRVDSDLGNPTRTSIHSTDNKLPPPRRCKHYQMRQILVVDKFQFSPLKGELHPEDKLPLKW